MLNGYIYITMKHCSQCTSVATLQCGNYCGTLYCGKECQRLDWIGNHFDLCLIEGKGKCEGKGKRDDKIPTENEVTKKTKIVPEAGIAMEQFLKNPNRDTFNAAILKDIGYNLTELLNRLHVIKSVRSELITGNNIAWYWIARHFEYIDREDDYISEIDYESMVDMDVTAILSQIFPNRDIRGETLKHLDMSTLQALCQTTTFTNTLCNNINFRRTFAHVYQTSLDAYFSELFRIYDDDPSNVRLINGVFERWILPILFTSSMINSHYAFAIEWSIRNRRLDIFNRLYRHPQIEAAANSETRFIEVAIKNNYPHVVRQLLNWLPPDSIDINSDLEIAIRERNSSICLMLLRYNARDAVLLQHKINIINSELIEVVAAYPNLMAFITGGGPPRNLTQEENDAAWIALRNVILKESIPMLSLYMERPSIILTNRNFIFPIIYAMFNKKLDSLRFILYSNSVSDQEPILPDNATRSKPGIEHIPGLKIIKKWAQDRNFQTIEQWTNQVMPYPE